MNQNNRALSAGGADALFWDMAEAHRLLDLLLSVRRRRWLRVWASASLLFWLVATICATSCYFERTLWLDPPGRGLLQHYGSLSNLFGLPLLLILTLLLLRRTAEAVDRYTESGQGQGSFPRLPVSIRDRIVEVLAFRSVLSQSMFFVMVLIGFLGLILNSINTRNAVDKYGNDVWDASHYVVGYLVGRLLLALEWLVVLPLAGYFTVAAILTVITIVAGYARGDESNLRPLDADGCGGFRLLGQVMLNVVYLLAVVGAILVAHRITHRNFYDTLGLAMVIFLIGVAVLIIPFLRLHLLLSEAKKNLLRNLGEEMWGYQVAMEGARQKSAAVIPAVSLLAQSAVYERAAALHTWPYLPTDRIKWLAPLLPILISLILGKQGL